MSQQKAYNTIPAMTLGNAWMSQRGRGLLSARQIPSNSIKHIQLNAAQMKPNSHSNVHAVHTASHGIWSGVESDTTAPCRKIDQRSSARVQQHNKCPRQRLCRVSTQPKQVKASFGFQNLYTPKTRRTQFHNMVYLGRSTKTQNTTTAA